MKEAQEKGEFTRLMYLQERVKVLPFGDVWAEYLKECGLDDNYFETISEYEKNHPGGEKMKDILTAPFVREMCETTANMYRLGWDERNGGNISYLLKEEEVAKYLDLSKVERVIL